jgi:hypothetical protein
MTRRHLLASFLCLFMSCESASIEPMLRALEAEKRGDYATAAALNRKAAEVNSDTGYLCWARARDYNSAADDYLKIGQPSEARHMFELAAASGVKCGPALKKEPLSASQAYSAAAYALEQLKRVTDAKPYWRMAADKALEGAAKEIADYGLYEEATHNAQFAAKAYRWGDAAESAAAAEEIARNYAEKHAADPGAAERISRERRERSAAVAQAVGMVTQAAVGAYALKHGGTVSSTPTAVPVPNPQDKPAPPHSQLCNRTPNYTSAVGLNRFSKPFPLAVYVDVSGATLERQAFYRTWIGAATGAWGTAASSAGLYPPGTLRETTTRSAADITIEFIPGGDPNGGSEGVTSHEPSADGHLAKAHVQLYAARWRAIEQYEGIDRTPLRKVIVSTVAHELGHAFGIVGHSHNSSDLMYVGSGDTTTPTTADLNTLAAAYCH